MYLSNLVNLNFSPQQLTVMPALPVLEEEKLVHQVEEEWLKRTEQLSAFESIRAKNHIKGLAEEMRQVIAAMSHLGCPSEEINQKVTQALKQFHFSAEQFFNNCASYNQAKKELGQTVSHVSEKIIQTSYPSFSTFVSPQHIKPKISASVAAQLETTIFFQDHKNKNNNEMHLAEPIKEIVTGKIAHQLEHIQRKPQATALEFFSNLLTPHIPENSKSPWRDKIISAAVHLSMTEFLAWSLPTRVPAYIATTGSHITAYVAREAESSLNKIAQNKEIEYEWNRQYELTGEGSSFAGNIEIGRMGLKLAQVPSDLLHAIHKEVSFLISHISDEIGLTSQNMADIAINALEIMGKNSLEAIEQKCWDLAIKDTLPNIN